MPPPRIFRIALIGPESTGKTTLCRQLAEHYNTVWLPEYARQYMEEKKPGRDYTAEDIVSIMRTHQQHERDLLPQAHRMIFIDTEYIVSMVWSEDRFAMVPSWIETQQRRFPCDLYLLTAPDLPWKPDPVRENPGRGEALFSRYRKALEDRRLPYAIIRGSGASRLALACEKVDSAIKLWA